MSPEARAAASVRMKKMLEEKRNKIKPQLQTEADPALQEALAKQPIRSDATIPAVLTITHDDMHSKGQIDINQGIVVLVNWELTPMPEAQIFYAQLKSEFEKAGKILNARSNAHFDGFDCFMCKKHFAGNPGFTDYSYRDPATGLAPRVDCCGELCVINYHKMRIDMRIAAAVKQGAEQREGR